MSGKFKKYFATRKTVKAECLKFADYIKRGYYVLEATNARCFFSKTPFLKTLKPSVFKKNYFLKGNGTISSFVIIVGTEKINFITDTIVVSKYLSPDISLENVFQNVNKYLPKLYLPHYDYVRFDFEKSEIVSKLAPGTSYSDEIHANKLLDFMIKSALTVVTQNINDVLFFVQHGDAYGNNIIWQGDNNFICIDNENVGFYPAFYDVFLLESLYSNSVDDFLKINKKYTSYFQRFCMMNKISFSNFYDNYLSFFVYFRFMSYPKDKRLNNHRSFLFLKDDNAERLFPNTVKLLKDLYLGNNNTFLDELYRRACCL